MLNEHTLTINEWAIGTIIVGFMVVLLGLVINELYNS